MCKTVTVNSGPPRPPGYRDNSGVNIARLNQLEYAKYAQ